LSKQLSLAPDPGERKTNERIRPKLRQLQAGHLVFNSNKQQERKRTMAIVMEANYSKKVGLPGYSSHQYMITLRTELADLSQVAAESARLHTLLQSSVDTEIQKVGYLPERGNGNGNNNRQSRPQNGNGNNNNNHNRDVWNCSPKQRQYIVDLVNQHNLDKNAVEKLAQERFGKSVRSLNKLEASGLIEELKEQNGSAGGANNNHNRASQPSQPAAGAR
jgi:hypothetical protein